MTTMSDRTMAGAPTGDGAGFGSGADLKRRLKPLLNPPRDPVLVDVPELAYLMVDGLGAPEEDAAAPTSGFQQAIGAIYPLAYTLKFRLKPDGLAMPILPLEALWYTGEGGVFDLSVPPSEWGWRLLLAVPDELTDGLLADAAAEIRRKKRASPRLDDVRLERWCEGRAAQVMHVGPYADERPTIERLHAFIAERGLARHGAHHEIYLGDPRAAPPDKLRTILRQPITEA